MQWPRWVEKLYGLLRPGLRHRQSRYEGTRGQVTHVIILDGTMSSLDQGHESNAGLAYRLLSEVSGARLSLYYEAGVQWQDWASTGDVVLGRGINRQIRRAYGYLASRYRAGDRIILMGYSRGAYAVRSLAGIIDQVGLLKAQDATERNIMTAYRHYQKGGESAAERAFVEAYCHDSVEIEMIGVWDTVKALGLRLPVLIPALLWWWVLHRLQRQQQHWRGIGEPLDGLAALDDEPTDALLLSVKDPTVELSMGPAIGVELQKLCFGHTPGKPPLLHSIDLTVAAGEWVAITGPSGCGKSTLLNLIAGLLQPDSGQVLLNGQPLLSLSHKQRSQAIAMVRQEDALLDVSLRENLTLWDPSISDEAMHAICHDLGLDGVLQQLPQGLDTVLDPAASTSAAASVSC